MTGALVPMSEIRGYEGLYSITKDGRVWAHPNHIHDGIWMKASLRNRYRFVCLCKSGVIKMFSIHRLVAITFLPNPKRLPQTNHKNSDREDNRVENLEWCTASHNSQHSWDSGTSKTTEKKRAASRRNAKIMLATRGIYI